MTTYQPNPELVQHMVGLLNDIQNPDNNRQMEIMKEMGRLSERPDFALNLVFLTSGCPGMNIAISEQARIAACTRLSRVFRDQVSPSRDALNDQAAVYIREQCIQYLNTTHPVIKLCIIDVLAYIAVWQKLEGWENIWSGLLTWLSVPLNVPVNSEAYIQKDTAAELVARIINVVTSDQALSSNLFRDDVENNPWKDKLLPHMFSTLIDLLLDPNINVRQNAASILNDCIAEQPVGILANSPRLVRNLTILGTTDEKPKSKLLCFSLLSSLATLNPKYIFGFNHNKPSPSGDILKGGTGQTDLNIKASQIHAHEKQYPVPVFQDQIPSPQENMFGLIDNLMLFASGNLTRRHTHCGEDECDVLFDNVAYEALSFLITVLHYNTRATMMIYRQALVRRHVANYLPLVFKLAQLTGCDIIEIEQLEQANRAEAEKQRLNGGTLTGTVAPTFHTSALNRGGPVVRYAAGNSDDEGSGDADDGDMEEDNEEDDDDTDANSMDYTRIRAVCMNLIDLTWNLAPEQSLAIFRQHITGLLHSQLPAERELGLFLLATFGRRSRDSMKAELRQAIPSLIDLMQDPHHIIRSIIPWCVIQLESIIVDLNSDGVRSTDGQHLILHRFFLQSVQLLQQNHSYITQFNIARALESLIEQPGAYLYFVELFRPLNEALLNLMVTSVPRYIPAILSFFGKFVETIGEDDFTSVDREYYQNNVLVAFLKIFFTVPLESETLADYLVALQQILYATPVDMLSVVAPSIYSHCISIIAPITEAMVEANHNFDLQCSPTNLNPEDHSLPWQVVNSWCAAGDVLNSLLECLESTFLGIVTECPLTPAMQRHLAKSFERVKWFTANRTTEELQRYGTLAIIIDALVIGMQYQDVSAHQCVFGFIGELCTQLPNNALLYNVYMGMLPSIYQYISLTPESENLLSNALWVLKVYLKQYRGHLFIFDKQQHEQRLQQPGPQPAGSSLYMIIEKCCAFLQIDCPKQYSTVQQMIFSAIGAFCEYAPQEFVSTMLVIANNIEGMVAALKKIVQMLANYPFEHETRWAGIAAMSNILPLITNAQTAPQTGPLVVQFLKTTAVAALKSEEANFDVSTHAAIIKANYGQLYAMSADFWVQSFAYLAPEEQAVVKAALQM